MDSAWNRTGARSAWVNAIAYFVAAILFSLVAFGITSPAEPQFIEEDFEGNVLRQFQFDEAVWPQNFASTLIFAIGFLSLAPVGLAIRESTGRGKNQQLLAMSFLIAAILGGASQLISIGVNQEAFNTRPFLSGENLIALDIARMIFNGPLGWLLNGFFLFAGFGTWFAAKVAREGNFNRGWGILSIVIAVLYFTGFLLQIAIGYLPAETEFTGNLLVSSQTAESVFELLVLVGGGVLAPIWSAWLALQFPRLESRSLSS